MYVWRFKTLIEQVTYGDPFNNTVIAMCEGQKYHTRPVRYKFTEKGHKFSGTEYTCIAGSLVWPSLQYPGYSVIVGVVEDNKEIHCLEEFTTEHIGLLYNYCTDVQKRYDKLKFDNVVKTWWGNADKIMSLVHEREVSKRLVISTPPDAEKEENFQIYLNRLITLSYKNNKVIKWGDCILVKNAVMSLMQGGDLKTEHNPVVACTGWLIHALILYKPWRKAVDRLELIPTSREDLLEHNRKREEDDMYKEIMKERARF